MVGGEGIEEGDRKLVSMLTHWEPLGSTRLRAESGSFNRIIVQDF